MIDRLIAQGIDPSLLAQRQRVREGASQGMQHLSLTLPQLPSDLAVKLEAAQHVARIDGIVSAFGEINLILLSIAFLGLMAILFIVERRTAAAATASLRWTPEATSMLERFPAPPRERSRQGFEFFAREKGLPMVTAEVIREVREKPR